MTPYKVIRSIFINRWGDYRVGWVGAFVIGCILGASALILLAIAALIGYFESRTCASNGRLANVETHYEGFPVQSCYVRVGDRFEPWGEWINLRDSQEVGR